MPTYKGLKRKLIIVFLFMIAFAYSVPALAADSGTDREMLEEVVITKPYERQIKPVIELLGNGVVYLI
ncbi:MAG TPA: hypothetical protein GXX49_04320 [Clostridiaceae bacterium]|nr:hypothetical protein [Clostridiaceae bacterium]